MSTTDPFTQVYNGLWEMAEANDRLMSFVKVRNRIKYDDNLGPKENVSEADLPELMLVSDGSPSFNIISNSHDTRITKGYKWSLATGDLNLENYNVIAWELLRSMGRWKNVLCSLTWNDCTFVRHFEMVSAEEGIQFLDENRGIRGWATVVSLTVDLHFSTTQLISGIS